MGFCFRGELRFLNCDDICVCVVNEQFEFLEFGFDSVYVDLKYNEIISLLLLGICACVVCVVMWLSFVYMDAVVAATVMRVLLCV